MRIISWNCHRGELRSRAALFEFLGPDLVILQECGQPVSEDDQCLWRGDRSIQGVGVVTNLPFHLAPVPVRGDPPHSLFPFLVLGPDPFHLLGVWAQRQPSYAAAIMRGLDAYDDFLRDGPCVVAGDFNTHPQWDDGNRVNHSTLVARLHSEFGLVSAYHALNTHEDPTLYWQWKREQPFHIDYCFIPESWVPRLRAVTVGGYEEWASESDHRPLEVSLE